MTRKFSKQCMYLSACLRGLCSWCCLCPQTLVHQLSVRELVPIAFTYLFYAGSSDTDDMALKNRCACLPFLPQLTVGPPNVRA
jgi:hypothetical protein